MDLGLLLCKCLILLEHYVLGLLACQNRQIVLDGMTDHIFDQLYHVDLVPSLVYYEISPSLERDFLEIITSNLGNDTEEIGYSLFVHISTLLFIRVIICTDLNDL